MLVPASNSLPRNYINMLEPWDLQNLSAFDERFLSGFQTEAYQVGLKDGFELAQDRMASHIRLLIKRDIGGDHQRIRRMKTDYSDITFKHILLPLWISAYHYKDKIYRFLINARTGEVRGERPYSTIKIAFAVILGIIIIVLSGLFFFINKNQ